MFSCEIFRKTFAKHEIFRNFASVNERRCKVKAKMNANK